MVKIILIPRQCRKCVPRRWPPFGNHPAQLANDAGIPKQVQLDPQAHVSLVGKTPCQLVWPINPHTRGIKPPAHLLEWPLAHKQATNICAHHHITHLQACNRFTAPGNMARGACAMGLQAPGFVPHAQRIASSSQVLPGVPAAVCLVTKNFFEKAQHLG